MLRREKWQLLYVFSSNISLPNWWRNGDRTANYNWVKCKQRYQVCQAELQTGGNALFWHTHPAGVKTLTKLLRIPIPEYSKHGSLVASMEGLTFLGQGIGQLKSFRDKFKSRQTWPGFTVSELLINPNSWGFKTATQDLTSKTKCKETNKLASSPKAFNKFLKVTSENELYWEEDFTVRELWSLN